jgi:hypothetical protein
VASSTASGAVYGVGIYGTDSYGVASISITVDGVQASGTAQAHINIVTADATHTVTSIQGVTATGGIGDVTAASVVVPAGVSATGAIGTLTARSVNLIPTPTIDVLSEAGNVVVVADANFGMTGVSATGSAGDSFSFQSIYSVTGVSATGTVDSNSVAANNARPTFTGVSATGAVTHGDVTTTTVLFNVINKDHERTASVEPDKPRIVYVRAA